MRPLRPGRRAPHHRLGEPLLGARVLERRRLARRRAHEAELHVPAAAAAVCFPERRRQVRQAPQPPVQLQTQRELGDPRDLDDGRGEGGYRGGEQVPAVLVRFVFLGGWRRRIMLYTCKVRAGVGSDLRQILTG